MANRALTGLLAPASKVYTAILFILVLVLIGWDIYHQHEDLGVKKEVTEILHHSGEYGEPTVRAIVVTLCKQHPSVCHVRRKP